jgi:hypothetical protein
MEAVVFIFSLLDCCALIFLSVYFVSLAAASGTRGAAGDCAYWARGSRADLGARRRRRRRRRGFPGAGWPGRAGSGLRAGLPGPRHPAPWPHDSRRPCASGPREGKAAVSLVGMPRAWVRRTGRRRFAISGRGAPFSPPLFVFAGVVFARVRTLRTQGLTPKTDDLFPSRCRS